MSAAAREWAALAARHPTPKDRCLNCGALDSHPTLGPVRRDAVVVFVDVPLELTRCRGCSTPDMAVAGRGWLQFKHRKELAIGARP